MRTTALVAACIVGLLGSGEAQTHSPAPRSELRTPWGEPDLQGVWTGSTLTPLERPASLAGKEFLSEAEAAAMEKRAAERRLVEPAVDLRRSRDLQPDLVRSLVHGRSRAAERRSSSIRLTAAFRSRRTDDSTRPVVGSLRGRSV